MRQDATVSVAATRTTAALVRGIAIATYISLYIIMQAADEVQDTSVT